MSQHSRECATAKGGHCSCECGGRSHGSALPARDRADSVTVVTAGQGKRNRSAPPARGDNVLEGLTVFSAGENHEDFPAHIQEAARFYQAGGYSQVNGALRRNEDTAGSETGQVINGMDELLANSTTPQAIEVWRGLRDPGGVFGDAWNDTDVTGLEWEDAGYVSTTYEPEVAQRFTAKEWWQREDGIMLRLRVPEGSRAVSLGPYENEIVLGRGQRFRVVADHGASADWGGRRLLDVEVVTDGD